MLRGLENWDKQIYWQNTDCIHVWRPSILDTLSKYEWKPFEWSWRYTNHHFLNFRIKFILSDLDGRHLFLPLSLSANSCLNHNSPWNTDALMPWYARKAPIIVTGWSKIMLTIIDGVKSHKNQEDENQV